VTVVTINVNDHTPGPPLLTTLGCGRSHGRMTAVTGIGQLHVSVSDLDASRRFYRDVLGLPHLFDAPGMAFFDAGGVRLYLARPEDERFRSRPVVYYRVADIDSAFAGLVERGAPVIGEPRVVHDDGTSALWVGFVSDPDGTPVAVMEERPHA
jgi:predicted enzyme related to lactoylglutathione lyase